MDSSTVEREVGPREKMFYLLHNETPPKGTVVHTVTLINRTKVEIREDDVRKSLEIICKYQPLLKMKLVEENKDGTDHIYFKQMSDKFIKINTETIQRKEEWVDLARKLLVKRFDVFNGPLWEVHFLKLMKDVNEDEEVVITFLMHHIIADAKSMSDVIQNQFLPVLHKVLTNPERFASVDDLDESLLDDLKLVKHKIYPCDELACSGVDINQAAPWYLKAALNIGCFFGRLLKFDKRIPKIHISDENDATNLDGYVIDVIPYTLPKELVSSIRSVGKHHSVALTSILTVALTIAIEEVMKERGKRSAGTYSIKVPMDKRRFNVALSTKPIPLGCYVGGTSPKMKPPATHSAEWIEQAGEIFWALCQDIQNQIDEAASDYKDPSRNEIRYLLDSHSAEQTVDQIMAQLGSNCHFGLSNAGVGDIINKVPELEVNEQYFTAAMGESNYTSLFITLITSHPGADLNILATYIPKWLDKLFINRLFEKLHEILQNEKILSNK